jgi:hypothetical protein
MVKVSKDDALVAERDGIDFVSEASGEARLDVTDAGALLNKVRVHIWPQWEYLGGLEVHSPAASTGVLEIPPRDFILIQFLVSGLSAADFAALRFNADVGSNYWSRYLCCVAGGSALTNVQHASQTCARLNAVAGTGRVSGSVAIGNQAGHPKGGQVSAQVLTGSPATCGPMQFGGFEWVNTTQQITKVELRSVGTGLLAVESGFQVFGKDMYA